MDEKLPDIQFVGASCGHHGSYTFYKSCRVVKGDQERTLCLGEFFFARLEKTTPLCILELQLLWEDRQTDNVKLASVKLYFQPKDTPVGLCSHHGKDELLTADEKMVLTIQDLVSWLPDPAPSQSSDLALKPEMIGDSVNGNWSDTINKNEPCPLSLEQSVIVLSYPQYCRYRSLMKRMETCPDDWLRNSMVQMVGGCTLPSNNSRVMFSRDTFSHPDLKNHVHSRNYLAPNLKGRPRRKRPRTEESADTTVVDKTRDGRIARVKTEKSTEIASSLARRKPNVSITKTLPKETRQVFLKRLYKFMRLRGSPIKRIPCLGFKEVDLYDLYYAVHKRGGYNEVTRKHCWKKVYDTLGCNQSNTSAATCTRRIYEKFILAYDKQFHGEVAVTDKSTVIKKQAAHKKESSVRSPAQNSSATDRDAGQTANVCNSSATMKSEADDVTPEEGKTRKRRKRSSGGASSKKIRAAENADISLAENNSSESQSSKSNSSMIGASIDDMKTEFRQWTVDPNNDTNQLNTSSEIVSVNDVPLTTGSLESSITKPMENSASPECVPVSSISCETSKPSNHLTSAVSKNVDYHVEKCVLKESDELTSTPPATNTLFHVTRASGILEGNPLYASHIQVPSLTPRRRSPGGRITSTIKQFLDHTRDQTDSKSLGSHPRFSQSASEAQPLDLSMKSSSRTVTHSEILPLNAQMSSDVPLDLSMRNPSRSVDTPVILSRPSSEVRLPSRAIQSPSPRLIHQTSPRLLQIPSPRVIHPPGPRLSQPAHHSFTSVSTPASLLNFNPRSAWIRTQPTSLPAVRFGSGAMQAAGSTLRDPGLPSTTVQMAASLQPRVSNPLIHPAFPSTAVGTQNAMMPLPVQNPLQLAQMCFKLPESGITPSSFLLPSSLYSTYLCQPVLLPANNK